MRAFLLLPLLLAGCVSASGIEVDVANSSDDPIWAAANSGGPRVMLQVEVGGDWRSLVPSVAWLCSRECGSFPGQVVCADVAPEQQIVWGLMEGDIETWVSSDELWYDDSDLFGDCGRRATESQTYRAEACWSDRANDADGVELPAPTETGVPAGLMDGAELASPKCGAIEFSVEEVPTLQLGL